MSNQCYVSNVFARITFHQQTSYIFILIDIIIALLTINIKNYFFSENFYFRDGKLTVSKIEGIAAAFIQFYLILCYDIRFYGIMTAGTKDNSWSYGPIIRYLYAV